MQRKNFWIGITRVWWWVLVSGVATWCRVLNGHIYYRFSSKPYSGLAIAGNNIMNCWRSFWFFQFQDCSILTSLLMTAFCAIAEHKWAPNQSHQLLGFQCCGYLLLFPRMELYKHGKHEWFWIPIDLQCKQIFSSLLVSHFLFKLPFCINIKRIYWYIHVLFFYMVS